MVFVAHIFCCCYPVAKDFLESINRINEVGPWIYCYLQILNKVIRNLETKYVSMYYYVINRRQALKIFNIFCIRGNI